MNLWLLRPIKFSVTLLFPTFVGLYKYNCFLLITLLPLLKIFTHSLHQLTTAICQPSWTKSTYYLYPWNPLLSISYGHHNNFLKKLYWCLCSTTKGSVNLNEVICEAQSCNLQFMCKSEVLILVNNSKSSLLQYFTQFLLDLQGWISVWQSLYKQTKLSQIIYKYVACKL